MTAPRGPRKAPKPRPVPEPFDQGPPDTFDDLVGTPSDAARMLGVGDHPGDCPNCANTGTTPCGTQCGCAWGIARSRARHDQAAAALLQQQLRVLDARLAHQERARRAPLVRWWACDTGHSITIPPTSPRTGTFRAYCPTCDDGVQYTVELGHPEDDPTRITEAPTP